MNRIFSLEQIFQTRNRDDNLVLRQNQLDLMARFREVKTINPKMKQKEVSNELGFSNSTLQRFRLDTKMQNPYKSNNPKKRHMTSNDLKKPQKTSKEPVIVSVRSNKKSKINGGDPSDGGMEAFLLNKLFLSQ